MRAAPAWLLLMLPFVAAASAGCMCSPESLQLDLGLQRTDEQSRTLPILSSGTTGLDVPIPDSHGYVDVKVSVPHQNLTYVNVHSLSAQLEVAGKDVPIRLLKVEGGRFREDGANGTWSGRVNDDETLRLWWTVDRGRIPTPKEIILPEGAAYAFRLQFEWYYRDCSFTAKGDEDRTFDGFVRATANTASFRPQGSAQIEAATTKAGFRANYTVKSGLTVTVQASSALIVFYGETGDAGIAVVPKAAWTVDGLPGSTVSPTATLQTFSADATGKYQAGAAFQPPLASSSGVYVLVQTISYRPTDGTLGATTDVFGHARDAVA